jgi:hypothetical protein
VYRIGQPIIIYLDIMNNCNQERILACNVSEIEMDYFRICDELGNEVQSRASHRMSFPEHVVLPPSRLIRVVRADISRYHLLKPGKYTVQFHWRAFACENGIPDSNSIIVSIEGLLSDSPLSDLLDRIERNTSDSLDYVLKWPESTLRSPGGPFDRTRCLDIVFSEKRAGVIQEQSAFSICVAFSCVGTAPWSSPIRSARLMARWKGLRVFYVYNENEYDQSHATRVLEMIK